MHPYFPSGRKNQHRVVISFLVVVLGGGVVLAFPLKKKKKKATPVKCHKAKCNKMRSATPPSKVVVLKLEHG